MSRKYFGTDGIRGRVGDYPITPDFVMRLGYAAGVTLLSEGHQGKSVHPAVLIGKDTRISGYMLEAALEAGFSAAGVDVMLAGPIPTPAVAYLTRALRLQAGVVISASHNPYFDNGIKFFSSAGTKLPDAVEQSIELRLDQPLGCVDSALLGRASRVEDAAGRYIEFCKSTFPNDLDLRGMKIALDCANGAAYHIAPKVFHELGADVVCIGVEPNGSNINKGTGATSPESLRDFVLESHADIGISFDGDADRVIMCGASGKIYDGDKLLYIIAQAEQKQSSLTGVVGTLMSNLGLEQAIERMGCSFYRAKVGDRYVLEMMREKNCKLGGESSGHVICMDKHTTGDGIISSLQVLAALKLADQSLEEACQNLVFYPQKLINVNIAPNFDWASNADISAAKDAAISKMGTQGRVLLRPSGTEPLLRVMVEGRDEEQVDQLAQHIADVITQVSENL